MRYRRRSNGTKGRCLCSNEAQPLYMLAYKITLYKEIDRGAYRLAESRGGLLSTVTSVQQAD